MKYLEAADIVADNFNICIVGNRARVNVKKNSCVNVSMLKSDIARTLLIV